MYTIISVSISQLNLMERFIKGFESSHRSPGFDGPLERRPQSAHSTGINRRKLAVIVKMNKDKIHSKQTRLALFDKL
jgi:hypothetical protein